MFCWQVGDEESRNRNRTNVVYKKNNWDNWDNWDEMLKSIQSQLISIISVISVYLCVKLSLTPCWHACAQGGRGWSYAYGCSLE